MFTCFEKIRCVRTPCCPTFGWFGGSFQRSRCLASQEPRSRPLWNLGLVILCHNTDTTLWNLSGVYLKLNGMQNLTKKDFKFHCKKTLTLAFPRCGKVWVVTEAEKFGVRVKVAPFHFVWIAYRVAICRYNWIRDFYTGLVRVPWRKKDPLTTEQEDGQVLEALFICRFSRIYKWRSLYEWPTKPDHLQLVPWIAWPRTTF